MDLKKKIDNLVEEVTTISNTYEVSKEKLVLSEMKNILKEAFEVNYCILWKLDTSMNNITSLDPESLTVEFEESLLYDVWEAKTPLLENHLISHKSYVARIDNPFNYRLKSMLIYPLVENKIIIGFLVLAKDIKQKGLLERDSYYVLEKLQRPLSTLIQTYEKREEQKSEVSPVVKTEVFQSDENEQVFEEKNLLEDKMRQLEVENKRLKQLQEDLVLELSNEKELLEAVIVKEEKIKSENLKLETKLNDLSEIRKQSEVLQNQINILEKHNDTLSLELEEKKKLIESFLDKEEKTVLENQKLKGIIAELELTCVEKDEVCHEHQKYAETIRKLQTSETISQKQVAYLESKVKMLQEENRLILSQKEQECQEYSPYNRQNISQLLPQILPTMGRYAHTYTLYEYIMYESQVSNMRMYEIEEKIKKSKLLWELFKSDRDAKVVPLSIHMTKLEMFVTKLEMFQVILLDDQIRLSIQTAQKFPTSFKIDSEKVLSTCFHLIHDITPFVTLEKEIYIVLDYIDDMLTIHIKGEKHESLDRLLNKNKFTAMLKERTDLMMAKKLVGMLSGNLESYIDEENCIHQLVLPARL
jgi:DNA repair exonuclease SbcCD ATPase subunit